MDMTTEVMTLNGTPMSIAELIEAEAERHRADVTLEDMEQDLFPEGAPFLSVSARLRTVRDVVRARHAALVAQVNEHKMRVDGYQREATRTDQTLTEINDVIVKHEKLIGSPKTDALTDVSADRLRAVIGHYVRRAEVAERKLERNEADCTGMCVESPDGRHYPERRWLSNKRTCCYCKKTLPAPEHGPMSDRCHGRGWIRHSGPPQDDWIHTGCGNPAMAPRCAGCVDCKDTQKANEQA